MKTGQVELIPWPESQGCVGCKFGALVQTTDPKKHMDSAYICIAEDRKRALCDNPEKL